MGRDRREREAYNGGGDILWGVHTWQEGNKSQSDWDAGYCRRGVHSND